MSKRTEVKPISEMLTAEEQDLFDQGPDAWGDECDRVNRGAAFLDREMAGWADRVSIEELDLQSPCACVLGQIFARPEEVLDNGALTAAKRRENDYGAGYVMGLVALGLENPEGAKPVIFWPATDVADQPYAAAVFMGFDHSPEVGYVALTEAWRPMIEVRKTKGSSA